MKSKELDQFYTHQKIALKCFQVIEEEINLKSFMLIEPSTGTGSFSNLFHENSISLDLDPKQDYIIKQDFLEFKLTKEKNPNNHKVITIGNPPFGKKSSLAIKFFNKSAEYSDYICMIFPQTFKKDSVVNRLDTNFHLIKEIILEKNSFVFEGKPYNVKSVFQIWQKKNVKRTEIIQKKESKYFQFVNKKDNPDFAIRRVGGLAGKLIEDFINYKESSHYYIKTNIKKEKLIKYIKESYDNLRQQAYYSAGNPSISKHEFITIIERKIEEKGLN
jgi:hypothetical protein